ncbi:MAG: N-acetyltransferase family protein [Streptosporangiaceae bacterium]
MAGPSIRAAVPDDAEEVERLRVAGWQTAYRGILPDGYLDRLRVDGERRRRHMTERAASARPAGVESVATAAGAIVGWVAGGLCRDADRPGPGHGEIYAIYVRPEWWGRGAGRLLMAHAVRALTAAGCTDITLWVLAANQRARRFYQAAGFRPDGTRQLRDRGAPVPELRYRLPAGR